MCGASCRVGKPRIMLAIVVISLGNAWIFIHTCLPEVTDRRVSRTAIVFADLSQQSFTGLLIDRPARAVAH